jgi:threonine/homoserine efflux transporter RhtA
MCGRKVFQLAFRKTRRNITLDEGSSDMHLQLSLAPIIALLAGLLILVQPRLLNFIVAIYLIIVGLLGLFGNPSFHLH